MNNETMITLSTKTHNESKCVSEGMQHRTFLDDLKYFLSYVVNHDAHLGLHTLRKTVCMLGMLG